METQIQYLIFDEKFELVQSSPPPTTIFGNICQSGYLEAFLHFCAQNQPCGTPSREKLQQYLQKAVTEGGIVVNWAYNLPTEGEGLAKVSIAPLFLGGKQYIVCCNKDLKVLTKEEEARRLLEQIVDISPLPCVAFDENFQLIKVNHATMSLHNLPSESAYMDMFLEISPATQPCGTPSMEKMTAAFSDVFQTGSGTMVWMHKNRYTGEPIPVEVTAEAVPLGDKKAVLVYGRDLRDFYNYKETEERIRSRLEAILDSSPLLVSVYDENANPIYHSLSGVGFYGFDSKEQLDEGYFLTFPEFQPDGRKSLESSVQIIKEVAQKGRKMVSPWLMQTLQGDPIPCEISLVPMMLDGEAHVIAHTKDLRSEHKLQEAYTRSLAVEAAEESNKAKSRFLARMSHEIRTPLTAILGISEMHLQGQSLPAGLEKSFIKIHNSSHLLLGIINDLLDFSKIESGKMELSPHEYCLADMIANVAHMHTVYLGSKGIKFTINVDKDLPSVLIGDTLRIEQIIINLLSNAFKYTEEGFVELNVGLEECKKYDGHITLVVAVNDTGVGMTEEQLAILFEEYARFYERGTHIVSGTGLGMPIVATLAHMMDAHVDVKSKFGCGTQVTVRIPQKTKGEKKLGEEAVKRLQKFETATLSNAEQFKLPPEPMPYGSVLVVDDVEANLYVAKGLLSFYDLQVDTCESGQAAINKIKQGNVYDIIFMDHMMPVMNGTEAKRALREMGYSQPIVALTANAIIGQAEEFIKEGFDDFVSKPISRKSLHAVLLKYVRDKQPRHVIEAARAATRNTEKLAIDVDNFQSGSELQNKLRKDFATTQQHTHKDICDAIQAQDLPRAHLLVHSLKGLAGLIHEGELTKIASKIERQLSEGKLPESALLDSLKAQLNIVLKNIGAAEEELPHYALLDELESMLRERKADAVKLVEELRNIPQAAILVHQVEKFDFKAALSSIAPLRDILG
ncbi:MAG: response regulator [Defluviitaleaceae bacterium]|nr:response regulator [Defluviitaleaceae bacterium]